MRINTLARLLIATHPELADAVRERYKPALKDYAIIPQIHTHTVRLFPDLDPTDVKILFIAAVYKLYCPETLVGAAGIKAPDNMRKAVSEALGYENGPNVNYWKSMAKAYLKQPAFKKKVDQLTEIAIAI